MLAVADGHRLALAVRARPELGRPAIEIGGTGPGAPSHRVTGWRGGAEGRAWECVLDHFDLEGDAHPARVFVLRTPRNGEEPARRLATLVLGP